MRKETDSLVTAYVDSLYEMRTSKTGGATEYVYYVSNGERTIAQVSEKEDSSPPAVSYLHVDNLGSTHVVTDGDGNLLDERSYDAFGNARSTDWTQGSLEPAANGINFGFTSQERDLEVDLVNMRGREYDSKIGQFLQSDPMVQNPLSSQSLNRYSYVLNNPLRFIDPTGFEPNVDGPVDGTQVGFSKDGSKIVFTLKGETLKKGSQSGTGQKPGNAHSTQKGATKGEMKGDSSKPGVNVTPSHDAKSDSNNPTAGTGSPDSPPAGPPADPNSPEQQDKDWQAAKAGLWNACLEQAQNAFNFARVTQNPLALFSQSGFNFGSLKASAPAGGREKEQYEFANTGATVLGTVLSALFAPEEAVAEGADAAAVSGNSLLSENAQHVYEILRTDASGNTEVFKYGISGGPSNAAGLSVRAEKQVSALNKAAGGEMTYESSIVQSIPGGQGARAAALSLERKLVYEYKALTGAKPLGNIRP